MKRVIIGINTDFSDSFYRISGAYADCVIAAGGFPLMVPCHYDPGILEQYIEMADGFVFTGGPDYPPRYYGARRGPRARLMNARRAKVDLYLAKAALARKLPALGICAGNQLLNIALGGKLLQHLPNAADHQSGKQKNGRREAVKHAVEITGGRILRRLFGRRKIIVNSYHHQAAAPAALGAGLEAAALAGGGVIEALESVRLPFVLGLQWHPERMPWRGHAEKIFYALIQAARAS